MAVWPDIRYPRLPDDNACNWLRVVSGTTLGGIAGVCNNLIGVRARRAVHKRWGLRSDPFGTGINRDTWWRDPQGVSETYRVAWQSNAISQYVCATLLYQAGTFDMSSTAKPDIAILGTLRSLTGSADIDAPGAAGAGVAWTVDAGTLRPQSFDFGQDDPDARVQWPVQVATTGDAIRADLAPPYPNGPRPFVIPDSRRGDRLELRFETTYVRILAADVWEIATADLDLP